MLTADTSGIADADGMTAATFSYQWVSNDGNRDADIAAATSSSYTPTDTDNEKTIKVRVDFTDDAGNAESLTSAATAAITSPATQLTAKFHNTPTSHDGQNPFTLELRFSEEFSFSYKTLRDHALTVTAGTVTRARRLSPPGNTRWEITILPDSNADVTILFSATHNCDDQGALCTPDARMLSADVTLTITGP